MKALTLKLTLLCLAASSLAVVEINEQAKDLLQEGIDSYHV